MRLFQATEPNELVISAVRTIKESVFLEKNDVLGVVRLGQRVLDCLSSK